MLISILDVLLIKVIFFIFRERFMSGRPQYGRWLSSACSKSFGTKRSKHVLHDVSFDVRAGRERLHSGAGGGTVRRNLKLTVRLVSRGPRKDLWFLNRTKITHSGRIRALARAAKNGFSVPGLRQSS